MHPEEIKAKLRMAGRTPAMLADELQVAPSSISQTISGRIRSERIQRRISQILGLSVSAIWPDQVILKRSRAQVEAQRRRSPARRVAA